MYTFLYYTFYKSKKALITIICVLLYISIKTNKYN